jgi:hypothetical protein
MISSGDSSTGAKAEIHLGQDRLDLPLIEYEQDGRLFVAERFCRFRGQSIDLHVRDPQRRCVGQRPQSHLDVGKHGPDGILFLRQ